MDAREYLNRAMTNGQVIQVQRWDEAMNPIGQGPVLIIDAAERIGVVMQTFGDKPEVRAGSIVKYEDFSAQAPQKWRLVGRPAHIQGD